MASPDAPPAFETAFEALVKYLQENIPQTENLKLPDSIVRPFKSVSRPVEICATAVRSLVRLFDNKKQRNENKMDPASFTGIVSIVFHLPHSVAQEKLLYIFLSYISAPEFADLHDRKSAISKRLLHTLLKRLVSHGFDKRLRWVAAQFIVVFIQDASSRDRLVAYSECQHLQTLLISHDEYVTRFLVADIVRTLCKHGAAIEDFFPEDAATQTILGFPKSEIRDVCWLKKLQDFFWDLDETTAFTRTRQLAFSVLDVAYDGIQQGPLDDSIAVIADRVIFVSATAKDFLQLTSIPLLRSTQMASWIETEKSTTLNIAYSDDAGYHLRSGTKRAFSGISFRLGSADEAAAALNNVIDAQTVTRHPTSEVSAPTPAQHRSVAFLDLWTGGNDPNTAHEKVKEIQETMIHNDVNSPLHGLSQRRSERAVSLNRSKNDEDTASESSFLAAQQDKRSLTKRFDTALDTPEQRRKTLAFTKAADTTTGRSRSRSRIRLSGAPDTTSVESATDISSRLPSEVVNKSRPLVPIFEESAPADSKATLSRADSASGPEPLPRLHVLAESWPPPERRPLVDRSTNPTTKASSSLLPEALPTKKSKPAGPMARLAAMQPRAASQKKGEHETSNGLKRKAQPAGKSRLDQDVDWDESFREETILDIPEDSQDEHLMKKAKARGGKVAAKKASAPKVTASTAKATKQSKSSKPSAKKTLSKPAARLQAEPTTLPATRQRRIAPKATTYDESSPNAHEMDSDQEDAGHNPNASQTRLGASKAIHKETQVEPEEWGEADTLDLNPRVQEPLNDLLLLQRDKLHSSDHSEKGVATAVNKANHPEGTGDARASLEAITGRDDNDEDVAQDSYPTATLPNPSAANVRTSFGTSLTIMLNATSAKKQNAAPHPSTPFGNKLQFVNNVNATKNSLPVVGLQEPKPPLQAQNLDQSIVSQVTPRAVRHPSEDAAATHKEINDDSKTISADRSATRTHGMLKLPSDARAKRPSLIHFDLQGPANQGLGQSAGFHSDPKPLRSHQPPFTSESDIVAHVGEIKQTPAEPPPAATEVDTHIVDDVVQLGDDVSLRLQDGTQIQSDGARKMQHDENDYNRSAENSRKLPTWMDSAKHVETQPIHSARIDHIQPTDNNQIPRPQNEIVQLVEHKNRLRQQTASCDVASAMEGDLGQRTIDNPAHPAANDTDEAVEDDPAQHGEGVPRQPAESIPVQSARDKSFQSAEDDPIHLGYLEAALHVDAQVKAAAGDDANVGHHVENQTFEQNRLEETNGTHPQQPTHPSAKSSTFLKGDSSQAQLRSPLSLLRHDNCEQPSELLVESASSEECEDEDSEYKQSEDEDAAEREADMEETGPPLVHPPTAPPVPRARLASNSRHVSPDFDDLEPVKPPLNSHLAMLKQATRDSIGLTALIEKTFPEAETEILPARSLSVSKKVVLDTEMSTSVQNAPSHLDSGDVPASQKLMPPPKRTMSINCPSKDREPSLSRSEPERGGSARHVRAAAASTNADRPDHANPMRVKQADLPITAMRQVHGRSSTPMPLYLMLEGDLENKAAAIESLEDEGLQRRSYATEEGADPTLVARHSNEQYFHHRGRSLSVSSDEPGKRASRELEPVPRALAGGERFMELRKSIHDAFWQLAQESLLSLRREQDIIEKEVESFERASSEAHEDMQDLWARKINHEGHKARGQLEDNELQYKVANDHLAAEKDWWTVLRVAEMEVIVDSRGKTMMDALQTLQKSLGV